MSRRGGSSEIWHFPMVTIRFWKGCYHIFDPPRRLWLGKNIKSICRFLNSTPGLIILNVFLGSISIALHSTLSGPERNSCCGLRSTEEPVKEERISMEEMAEAAREIFQYMEDQKVGKAKPWPLDYPPQPTRGPSCWFKPGRPTEGEMKKNNYLWQTVPEAFPDEMYLWAAFLDLRESPIFPHSHGSVQVLVMVRRVLSKNVYCYLWIKGQSNPVIVPAFYRHIWQRAWDPRNRFYTPWLISCPLNYRSEVDSVIEVSISTEACGDKLGNLLPIHNSATKSSENSGMKGNEGKIVVCVKGMDFLEDTSYQLIEWFELQFLLGADKVLLYTYTVHSKTDKVIQYYKKHRNVQQIKLSLPGSSPTLPYQRSLFIWRNRQQKRRNEIIPYNDCLYRHIHSHQYLLIIDTDEIVTPQPPYSDWQGLLKGVQEDSEDGKGLGWTAFSIRNAFFFHNLTKDFDTAIPPHFHMLRHNIRSKAISGQGQYGKSFVAVKNAATVFNHYPLHKQYESAKRTYYVSPKKALKLHFKAVCPIESRDECPKLYENTVVDHSLKRYEQEIIKRASKVIKAIGLDV